MNAKQYLDRQAEYLRSQGWNVDVTVTDYPLGQSMTVSAQRRQFEDLLLLGATFRTSTGRWAFHGLTRCDYKGNAYKARTYSDSSITIRVYGKNYSGQEA